VGLIYLIQQTQNSHFHVRHFQSLLIGLLSVRIRL